jgi:hypothetical protein
VKRHIAEKVGDSYNVPTLAVLSDAQAIRSYVYLATSIEKWLSDERRKPRLRVR